MGRYRQRGLRFTLALVVVLGCVTMDNAVRIGPDATTDSLVFLLTSAANTGQPPTLVYGLSVVRCNTEEAFWTVAADGSRQMPTRIVYGRPIAGFPARAGPVPLTPGCYEVILSGAAPRRFEVRPDRTISTRDSASSDRSRP